MTDKISKVDEAQKLLPLKGLGQDEQELYIARNLLSVRVDGDEAVLYVDGRGLPLNAIDAAELGLWLLRFSVGAP